MFIKTENGWKQLSPRVFAKPTHVPTLLEQMGIPKESNVDEFVYAIRSYVANVPGVNEQVMYRQMGRRPIPLETFMQMYPQEG